MASRDNQMLQIALILAVITTVTFGVTTYMFYAKAKTATADLEKAQEESTTADARKDAYYSLNELLRWMVGDKDLNDAEQKSLKQSLASDPELPKIFDNIDKTFREDVALFQGSSAALGTPEGWTGNQNWATLADYLVQVIQKRNQEWNDEKGRADKAELDKNTFVSAEVSKREEAEEGHQQKAEDLASQQKQFTEGIQGLRDQNSGLVKKMTEDKNTAEQRIRASEEAKVAVQSRNSTLVQLNLDKSEEIKNLQRRDYDVPDGQIRWVNQKSRSAYIDLGSVDAVKRQQTFSVYDRDETNHTNAEPKASIEVTRVVDDHLSEAQILDDDLSNPILPGDFVFTPAWVPGRRVHFAITGFIDFDQDGKSDLGTLMNLISLNGGIVDSNVNDQGDIAGRMTVHTRYLVQGSEPPSEEVASTKSLASLKTMLDDALQLGVEVISVERLLGFMGYRGEVQTQKLGRRGAAEGTQPSPFRKRQPIRSAY